jgi:glycosyltransferase involved in cell wall biosynthesis
LLSGLVLILTSLPEVLIMIDLVMWTFNGAKTLPVVLGRINKVVPKDKVRMKLVVDDGSTDDSCKIAVQFGWQVVSNNGRGISDGANTALSYVGTDYFASFEQDLLLSPDWYRKVSWFMNQPGVGAVSGMRFADRPVAVNKLQKYVARKYRGERVLSPWLKAREWSAFTLGKSLDNTMYKTSALKEIGGFPNIKTNVGIDTALAYKLDKAGFLWPVDYELQSVHLRNNLRHELNHQEWYGSQLPFVWRYVHALGYPSYMGRFSVVWRLFNSFPTGVFVALKTRTPSVVYTHPLMRFYFTRGLLKAGGKL